MPMAHARPTMMSALTMRGSRRRLASGTLER
jgi:hypothetical protein